MNVLILEINRVFDIERVVCGLISIRNGGAGATNNSHWYFSSWFVCKFIQKVLLKASAVFNTLLSLVQRFQKCKNVNFWGILIYQRSLLRMIVLMFMVIYSILSMIWISKERKWGVWRHKPRRMHFLMRWCRGHCWLNWIIKEVLNWLLLMCLSIQQLHQGILKIHVLSHARVRCW